VHGGSYKTVVYRTYSQTGPLLEVCSLSTEMGQLSKTLKNRTLTVCVLTFSNVLAMGTIPPKLKINLPS